MSGIWTEENDRLLAIHVIKNILEGSTQLAAFGEVGDKLNRSAGEVGFRWNAIVRHDYAETVQLAKKERQLSMRM